MSDWMSCPGCGGPIDCDAAYTCPTASGAAGPPSDEAPATGRDWYDEVVRLRAALASAEQRARTLEVALIQAIRCAGRVSGDGITVLLPSLVAADGWPDATLHAEPRPSGNILWRVRAWAGSPPEGRGSATP
jgi:hypothetical protein